MYRVWKVITSVLPRRFGGYLGFSFCICGYVTGSFDERDFVAEAINWKCDRLSSRWVIRFVALDFPRGNRESKSPQTREICPFDGAAVGRRNIWLSWKNKILSVSKLAFDGENEYIGRRLEGEMWLRNLLFFLRGEGGERRKRGRIIKFYFDFARGEFLLYV